MTIPAKLNLINVQESTNGNKRYTPSANTFGLKVNMATSTPPRSVFIRYRSFFFDLSSPNSAVVAVIIKDLKGLTYDAETAELERQVAAAQLAKECSLLRNRIQLQTQDKRALIIEVYYSQI
jgi:hypothetical protein